MLLIWLAIFISSGALITWLGFLQARELVRHEMRTEVAQLDKLRLGIDKALRDFKADVTARPCSSEFRSQLRVLAFRPDGISEFLYAPQGQAECSTTRQRFEPPASFGPPDADADNLLNVALWVDRDLEFIGLQGVRGTIALRDPFALVIPIQSTEASSESWIKKELVLRAGNSKWWHLSGQHGIYNRHLASPTPSLGSIRELSCDQSNLHCFAVEASLSDILDAFGPFVVASVILLALFSASAAGAVQTALFRYWAFEQRFKRNLDERSVICVYQPIVDMRTGDITACEVLARWRDVDASVVTPDRFIPLVESGSLTRKFTQIVVDKAYAELVAHLEPKSRLQINFNIFPRDLDADVLSRMLARFVAASDRFDVAVEIVETDKIATEEAQSEIQALSLAGIKTYIDDFGTGYSNIHHVAALSVEGVKLDRSFAMSPRDSVMAKMIAPAVDIVKTSGRALVVEGVETAERLELLRRTGLVDYVQGYLFSAPVPIEEFALMLRANRAGQWNAA